MSDYYARQVQTICGCSLEDAYRIEGVMREDILHSTLDWLDEGQFRVAAVEAQTLYREEKTAYDTFAADLRRRFWSGRELTPLGLGTPRTA